VRAGGVLSGSASWGGVGSTTEGGTAVQVAVDSGIQLVRQVAVVWSGVGGVRESTLETGVVGAGMMSGVTRADSCSGTSPCSEAGCCAAGRV